MNFHEAELFIDGWGFEADEFFVVGCDRNLNFVYLAKDPGSATVKTVYPHQLSYPDGKRSTQYYPGDLVKVNHEFL